MTMFALGVLIGLLIGVMLGVLARRPVARRLEPLVRPPDLIGAYPCDVCGEPALPLRTHEGRRLCPRHKGKDHIS